MQLSFADRWTMLFVLEGGWLLCVLQLAETPLFATGGPPVVALVLCLGASCLAVALMAVARRTTHSPFDARAICQAVGVVLFASGLFACVTISATAPGGIPLICLGLILAITGMTRRRPPPANV